MAQGRAAAAAGGHGWNLSLLQTMQQETREIPFCNQRQELRLVGHKLLHGASSVLERGCWLLLAEGGGSKGALFCKVLFELAADSEEK